jgi:hypothetical protein
VAQRPPLPDRFERTEDWNPDSWQQVQKLAAHLGVKLPKRKDATSDEDVSTEKKHLKVAARKHPIFQVILDCRERWKLVSTYNWKPSGQGRVGGTVGHHPSTWRKSMRDYNLQNVPKRSDLAHEFRRMVVASPGHVLVEADSSAIEAVLVGHFARSPRYINLAKAGIHDWFNAVVHDGGFSPDLPYDELRAQCLAAKAHYSKESREVAKRVVHLTAYRGTPERIHEEYPDHFDSTATARRLQNMLLSTDIGGDLKAWWQETLDRAGKERFLVNPFGLRHRFYHIFTYNKTRGTYEPNGDDAKRAIAFLPQSTASFLQDEYVLTLWHDHPEFREWACVPIHDSLLCEVPEAHAQEAAATLHKVFTMPIPELGGLVVGAEVNIGPHWADMTTWTG